MGEYPSVASLALDNGLVDILHPPVDRRDRSALTSLPGQPKLTDLRMTLSPRAGAVLDMTQNVLRANHFLVDLGVALQQIIHYCVKVFKYELHRTVDASASSASASASADGSSGGSELILNLKRNLVLDTAGADSILTVQLIKQVLSEHPEWATDAADGGRPIGITYDGRAGLFSTACLDFTLLRPVALPSPGTPMYALAVAAGLPVEVREVRERGQYGPGDAAGAGADADADADAGADDADEDADEDAENGAAPKAVYEQDVVVAGGRGQAKYRVTFTEVRRVDLPHSVDEWRETDNALGFLALRALDSAVFNFARSDTGDDPKWLVDGSKVFYRSSAPEHLTPTMVAMKGFYAHLKPCFAGLTLVIDMNVSPFLTGGPMIELMRVSARCRTVDDLDALFRRTDADAKKEKKRALAEMNEVLQAFLARVQPLSSPLCRPHLRSSRASRRA